MMRKNHYLSHLTFGCHVLPVTGTLDSVFNISAGKNIFVYTNTVRRKYINHSEGRI